MSQIVDEFQYHTSIFEQPILQNLGIKSEMTTHITFNK